MLVVTRTAAHCARTLHGSSLAGSESGDCDGARESGASQEPVRRQRVEISGDTLRGGGSSTFNKWRKRRSGGWIGYMGYWEKKRYIGD